MKKIVVLISQKVRKTLIKISYFPEKIMYILYHACANHKLYCPDKIFQKWDYWIFNKKKLNFKNPQTYNEKLQWMKYYYHNPAYTPLADKYEVRKYVEEKVGSEILIPCIGVFEKWDEIDFSKLPNAFVIKCTHDSGSVVICRDKSRFNFDAARKRIEHGLSQNHFYKSREWPYKNIKPRIIIEEYMSCDDSKGIVDYKYLCFDGVPRFVNVVTGRNSPNGLREDIFDMNWNHQEAQKDRYPNSQDAIICPDCFTQMAKYSEILSKDMPHVRVDFFVKDGLPFFTELTFFHDGGRIPFNPESFDEYLGSFIKLPPKMR